MVLKQATKGASTIAVAVLAFVAGMAGWSALSGAIAGVLAGLDVVIPASTLLSISPVVGFVAAGYAVQEVTA